MGKITGIGGIFFKCDDPQKLKDWYGQQLGLPVTDYGTLFKWRDGNDPAKEGTTVWGAFDKNTTYFEPSTKDFMISYRVEGLDELVAQLKRNGVRVLDEISVYDYGKFVHILDPEGNNIELWEDLS